MSSLSPLKRPEPRSYEHRIGQTVVIDPVGDDDLKDFGHYSGLSGTIARIEPGETPYVQIDLDSASIEERKRRQQVAGGTWPFETEFGGKILLPLQCIEPLDTRMDPHILAQVRRALAHLREQGYIVTTCAVRDWIISHEEGYNFYTISLTRRFIHVLTPSLIFGDSLPYTTYAEMEAART